MSTAATIVPSNVFAAEVAFVTGLTEEPADFPTCFAEPQELWVVVNAQQDGGEHDEPSIHRPNVFLKP
jgi:hypothetical protein